MGSRVLSIAAGISLAILGTGIGAAVAQVSLLPSPIDPRTLPKDLLPVAPTTGPPPGTLTHDDLAQVPEVQFRYLPREQFRETIGQQIAGINFLNAMSADHFIEVLRENRPDLAGLPFVVGDTCRLKEDERARFASAVLHVRASLRSLPTRTAFWQQCRTLPEDRFTTAALTQMLATDDRLLPGLLDYLARCEHEEATRTLARLAVFSPEPARRQFARAVLQQRDTQPATAILQKGLRYPWPAVARNAIEAVVELRRTDLVPDLERMLTEPDPRVPVRQTINGKEAPVVRELVRINHLRNCLLCHLPGNAPEGVRQGKVDPDNVHVDESLGVLIGEMPAPDQAVPLWSASQGNPRVPSVRADVTYLRQDFSLLQEVPSAAPWPDRQRFDFLVRERVLTEEEAQAYQAELGGPEESSPYRQAARSALRKLTNTAGRTNALWIALGCTSLVVLPGGLAYRFGRLKARRRVSVAA
jgi:hypothetical protein